jgi:hypothetical protein
MHTVLPACHLPAMRFATVPGGDFEGLEPIVKLERANCEMETAAGHRRRESGCWCGGPWLKTRTESEFKQQVAGVDTERSSTSDRLKTQQLIKEFGLFCIINLGQFNNATPSSTQYSLCFT